MGWSYGHVVRLIGKVLCLRGDSLNHGLEFGSCG